MLSRPLVKQLAHLPVDNSSRHLNFGKAKGNPNAFLECVRVAFWTFFDHTSYVAWVFGIFELVLIRDMSMKRLTMLQIGFASVLFIAIFALNSCGGSESTPSGSSESTPFDSAPNEVGAVPDLEPLDLDDTSFLLINNKDEVFKLNALTGTSELLIEEQLDLVHDVDVMDNTIYLTTERNQLAAYDLSTGRYLWDVPLGEFTRSFDLPTAPVCGEGRCYALGVTGILSSFDGNGQVMWATDLGQVSDNGERIRPPNLLVTSDTIYASTSVAESDRNLYVIDRDDGTVQQIIQLQHTSISVPEISGDKIVVPTLRGYQVFNRENLDELWRIERGPEIGLTRATIVNNTMVFTEFLFSEFAGILGENEEGQRIVGLDLDSGVQKWAVPAGRNDIPFDQSTDGNVVYGAMSITCSTFSACNARPMAIDPDTGQVLWSRRHVVQFAPLAVPGFLFYGDITDVEAEDLRFGVTAVDPSNGDVRWVSRLNPPRNSTPPVLVHRGQVFRRPSAPAMQSQF